MNREIYQKQYDFELEQRNALASVINIPIVALTVLGGALSSMVIGFDYTNTFLSYLFIALILITIIAIGVSLYFVFKSFLNYEYKKMPPARKMEEHLLELNAWSLRQHTDSAVAETEALKEFEKYFDLKLSEASERNSQNNIARGNCLHIATLSVSISFVVLIFASPIYIYQKINQPDMIHNVNVVNEFKISKKEKVMNEKTDSNSNHSDSSNDLVSTPEAPIKPDQSADPKPQGPDNVVFKANIETTNIAVNRESDGTSESVSESSE